MSLLFDYNSITLDFIDYLSQLLECDIVLELTNEIVKLTLI